MFKIIIDNKIIEVNKGSTIKEAADKLNIFIPTLCYNKDLKTESSCLICLVKNIKTNNLIPACSSLVENEMKIDTQTAEVIHARKAALNLLLSEHAGDCIAPCQKADKNKLNIPLLLKYVQNKDFSKAYVLLTKKFSDLSDITPDVFIRSEKACRRKQIDQPVAITKIIQFLLEHKQIKNYDLDNKIRNPAINTTSSESILTKITKEEFNELLEGINANSQEEYLDKKKYNELETIQESLRCLSCDCKKNDTCKLRQYAKMYQARQKYFHGQRNQYKRIFFDRYIFEAGKCIKCGICIQICKKNKIHYGFTFLNRGFELEVGFPFNRKDLNNLKPVITECIEKCPTGALTYR